MISMFLLGYKATENTNHKYNVGSDNATQVYYRDDIFGGWGWGFLLTFGYRVEVSLTEYSSYTPISVVKDNVELWWTVSNPTNATVTRTQSTTVSLAGEISAKISSGTDLIKKEIGAEVSASYSETISLQVVCPPNTSIDVYTYTALKKIGYLKEVVQPQSRILFWFVNTGNPATFYGTARAFKGAGTDLVYQ